MGRWFFTADTHFGHGNIIKYCLRPFMDKVHLDLCVRASKGELDYHAISLPEDCVRRMDNSILSAINRVVGARDHLVIAGDFCLAKKSVAEENYRKYRRAIACENVHLVLGNHDDRQAASGFFSSCQETMTVRSEGQEYFISHYPARSWNKAAHGSIMLYGHVHGAFVSEDEHGISESCRSRLRDRLSTALLEKLENPSPELVEHLLKIISSESRKLMTVDIGVDHLRDGVPFGTPWSCADIAAHLTGRR